MAAKRKTPPRRAPSKARSGRSESTAGDRAKQATPPPRARVKRSDSRSAADAQAGRSRGETDALRTLETLEAAYALWLERKVDQAALRASLAQERKRLEDQATFVLNTVRAAEPGAPALASAEALTRAASPLGAFVAQAQQSLERAREALERRTAELEARFTHERAALEETILTRVQRRLTQVRPLFRVLVRPAGADRRILHVERLRPDDAVVALFALTGKIPSRYGFLFDDSTEDVALAPAPLYAEEGLSAAEVRPPAGVLASIVAAPGRVLPVKGLLPLRVRLPDGGAGFARLLQRGPVMEAELQEGDGFRGLLTVTEAEQLAAELLRLKLEGRLELELAMG